MFESSRRQVLGGVIATTTLAGAGAAKVSQTLTAGDVIERMKAHFGAPWREGGVDDFKAGSTDTLVRGIATTMMATFDTLKRAARQGLNMIITHEPTYWSHQDNVSVLQDDPLYRRKLAYLRAHDMVSYHLHDHWHALRPVDGINKGMQDVLGWAGSVHRDNQRLYTLPRTSLLQLARELERKLSDYSMRIVGDPDMNVSVVYESWGNCSAFPGIEFLQSEADVLVIGEAQDWDLIAYARDLVTSGAHKALIILGHVKSEQWGMKFCADWLRPLVPEVPVAFIGNIEPYWTVDRPVFEIDRRG